VARFLLKPGRNYQQAVELFQPYEKIKEVYEEGRAAARKLIEEARRRGSETYIYVNNRFEGNSIETIKAIVPPRKK
jgi:hypothetical protein